jgi:ATP-binding cassette, subfamily B, bacterial PglK
LNTFHKLLGLLSGRERAEAILLFLMIFIMALLDVLGVASIMPFMAVLANPEIIQANNFLASTYKYLGFYTSRDFLLFLGFFVFALLVFSLLIKAFTVYLQLRFTLNREYSFGRRLMAAYISQPYEWFLHEHSANLGMNILSEVSTVINQCLMPFITIISQGAVAIALFTLLLFVDSELALIVGAVLGLAYGLILKLMNEFLSGIGGKRVKANQERFTVVSDAFGAIKEVKSRGLEAVFVNRFALPAQIYAKHHASAQAVAQLPRFILEAVAFGGLILLILILLGRNQNFESAIPIISLYAFSGYRLMPALQQIYAGISQLRFAKSSLNILYADLKTLELNGNISHGGRAIPLRQVLELKNVCYRYPGSDKDALRTINMSILAHSTVGIVGLSGSGKTTLVDLILGLLRPGSGELEVDGQFIHGDSLSGWKKSIGYVPQQIYLADDSVAANIAFGMPHDQIDQLAVENAARMANLHEFVVGELADGYATKIGERGVRLSGGQRQRIGIARALYHTPSLLILDEATSALDNLTENAVMESVNELNHKITIVMIAHRLTTVRKCDQIYLLNNGKIEAKGSYEELKGRYEIFHEATHD